MLTIQWDYYGKWDTIKNCTYLQCSTYIAQCSVVINFWDNHKKTRLKSFSVRCNIANFFTLLINSAINSNYLFSLILPIGIFKFRSVSRLSIYTVIIWGHFRLKFEPVEIIKGVLIFSTGMKILNPGSCDISQKLRQTKCLLFKIWRLKFTTIPKKVIWHLTIWQNWCFGQFYHSKIEK